MTAHRFPPENETKTKKKEEKEISSKGLSIRCYERIAHVSAYGFTKFVLRNVKDRVDNFVAQHERERPKSNQAILGRGIDRSLDSSF